MATGMIRREKAWRTGRDRREGKALLAQEVRMHANDIAIALEERALDEAERQLFADMDTAKYPYFAEPRSAKAGKNHNGLVLMIVD